MDTGNHNVLQFVSAAAQIFEKQETEDMEELLQSSDALFNQTNHNATIEEKSSQIKELLAEATGIIYEEPKTTLPSRHNLPMTLEERLKVVFNLPSSEVLRGGKR
ncbi:hypothetical protein BCV72DRAFT_216482 [Rhizopus microsporus var. microsporus]|uniref:Uncharacterized protein n=1 Tax=Rhizopus microsporus var. microsporus TaxID=86635 RepID=A0A1X0QQ42_RHIZD|nr:hypothetical protein BCV72DRAFT_216482 [Rhizopus microsporus var. microsporus]